METIIYEIGAFVLTLILYAIPILTACSFIYKWDGFFQTVLLAVSMIEVCGLADFISRKGNSRK